MVNVRAVERDQQFLMRPSVLDWLPEDHLAWFIVDLVAELDLAELYASLRADGRGGASYHPEMMLAVLLYVYCVGERASRRIERRLVEDVASRVVAANQCPDHATLARFGARHREAVSGLFSQVLGLCVTEGLVKTGVVAIDGTRPTRRPGRTGPAVRSPMRSSTRPKPSTLPKTKSSETAAATSFQTNGQTGTTVDPG